jgi:hypothetical protein
MAAVAFSIAVLTGNQYIVGVKAFELASGFPEKGSHSSECADFQPARHLKGFFFGRLIARLWGQT